MGSTTNQSPYAGIHGRGGARYPSQKVDGRNPKDILDVLTIPQSFHAKPPSAQLGCIWAEREVGDCVSLFLRCCCDKGLEEAQPEDDRKEWLFQNKRYHVDGVQVKTVKPKNKKTSKRQDHGSWWISSQHLPFPRWLSRTNPLPHRRISN